MSIEYILVQSRNRDIIGLIECDVAENKHLLFIIIIFNNIINDENSDIRFQQTATSQE